MTGISLRTRWWLYGGIALDISTSCAAFVASYMTVFGAEGLPSVPGLQVKVLGFVATFTFFLWAFSMHRGSWRYVSIPDLLTILRVSAVSVVVYTVAAFLLTRGSDFPRSVPVLTLLYLVAGLSFTRLAYRLWMEHSLFSLGNGDIAARGNRNVLLYGLTDNAESFIRSTRRGQSEFNILGILDNEAINQSRMIQGVKVRGEFSKLGPVLSMLEQRGLKVAELIVTQTDMSRKALADVVQQTAQFGLKVSRLPDFSETSSLTQAPLTPKEVDLADLLDRAEILPDLEGVARLVNNRVIFVTGAGGSIGSELCRQIAGFGPSKLVVTDSSEFHLYLLDAELREKLPALDLATRIMDVRDRGRVDALLSEFRPDSVFHAAALKHVPLVEANPIEGIKTNLFGTRNVADAALEQGVRNFVVISTDKAVNPTNVMGATKRAAEAYCQALDIGSTVTRFKTVRFGNVLGSNGSVVPRFQQQIASGGPVTVTHPNIVRFFMTIPEAVKLVLNASSHQGDGSAERGKIMVLDMGQPVKIVDLAERMIQLAGLKPYADVDIVFTGLRPGEKLYEELFDPSEVQETAAPTSYFVASPRIIDKDLLLKTLASLQEAVAREDRARSIELLKHIVPEYSSPTTERMGERTADATADPGKPVLSAG